LHYVRDLEEIYYAIQPQKVVTKQDDGWKTITA